MNQLALVSVLVATLAISGCGKDYVQIKQEEALYAPTQTRNANARRFFEEIDKEFIGPVHSVGFQDRTGYKLTESAKQFAERAGKAFVSTDIANIILLASVKKERRLGTWMWYTVTVRAVKPSATRDGSLLLATTRREGECDTNPRNELRPCKGFARKLFEHALYSLANTGTAGAYGS